MVVQQCTITKMKGKYKTFCGCSAFGVRPRWRLTCRRLRHCTCLRAFLLMLGLASKMGLDAFAFLLHGDQQLRRVHDKRSLNLCDTRLAHLLDRPC